MHIVERDMQQGKAIAVENYAEGENMDFYLVFV